MCHVVSHVPSDPKDPIAIERLNLMNMAKLSIKGLIESALNLGRTLDSDYAPLQQFFVVMEHCLKHGLKSMPRNLEHKSFQLFFSPLSLYGALFTCSRQEDVPRPEQVVLGSSGTSGEIDSRSW